ncbi:MAG: TonB-dependent receptor domain-containing protein [Leptonema sp. (in: bacteria)]
MNYKNKFQTFAILVSFLLTNWIFGQEATIVVKGDKPNIIKSEKISETGYTEFAELLKEVDGVHNLRKGKSSVDINIRGFMKDNINILPNGEKIYGACPNRMDPPSTMINLEEFKTIEVIKGPYDVKNQGSMGGAVYTELKDIKTGLENSVRAQTGSYDEKSLSFRSAYGTEVFKISVSGNYTGYRPYKDGNGKSITEVYPDLNHPLYFFPLPSMIMINGNNYMISNLNYEYPGLLPDLNPSSAPSSNRYKYNKRNVLTERKSAELRMVVNPNPNTEIEISGGYHTTLNGLTPYLFMDMVWDDMKKGSLQYKQKNISEMIASLSLKFYGNEILHDMTDELRCSSNSNSINCVENTLSRSYGMRSWATSSIKGIKLESELKLLGKTNLGIDSFIRKWNVETTMRMPYPMNLVRQIPSMSMGMGMGMGMGSSPMVMVNYRTQNSIPDTESQNLGVYLENENQIANKLNQKLGLRYDNYTSKAKVDRRILYNIYYPNYTPILQYQYVSYTEAYTTIDAEVTLPKVQPEKKFSEGSGYIKWEYEINTSLTAKLGLGYGTRFPDPQELYFALIRSGTIAQPDFVGNPNLKATRNREIDLGITNKTNSLKLDVDLFYSDLDNFTIIRNTPDNYLGSITKENFLYHYEIIPAISMMGIPSYNLYQYTNALVTYHAGIVSYSPTNPYGRFARTYKQVDARMYGGEISLKYQISDSYLVKGGLAYTRGINDTENTNLPEIPPLKGKFALRYIIKEYFAEIEGEFAAVQSLVDKNIGERRTAGWGIGNLKFGYEINKEQKNSMKINFGIRNIFNKFYYEHLSYLRDPFSSGIKIPEPGRNLFANIEIKF